jgi:predicted RecB family nuclease
MTVTASVLYDLVQCPQRVALDAFGDAAKREPIKAFVRLLWERGALFERETIAKLSQPFTDLSKASDSDRERLTLEAMARGDSLIHGGCIRVDDLLGVPDLLRREPGGYVPGDIKSGRGKEGGNEENDGKPKPHYAVQLALYVDILERLKASAGRRAFVWDIRGNEVAYDFTTVEGDALWDDYQTALTETRNILARQTTPLRSIARERPAGAVWIARSKASVNSFMLSRMRKLPSARPRRRAWCRIAARDTSFSASE